MNDEPITLLAAIGNALLEPGMEAISKPFALEVLAQKVGAMIDGGPVR